MSEQPKVVRITYEFSDGSIRQAEGADADAIDKHVNGLFAMAQVRGRRYAGPTMREIRPPGECPDPLRELEFVEWHGPRGCCPRCGNGKREGHSLDCTLAAALRKARREG